MRHSETTNEIIGILLLLLTGVCALGFPFLLSRLFHRPRLLPLAALIAAGFGIGVGYAGAWFRAYDESRGDFHFNHFYQVFSLLALPASLVAEGQSGHGDWQIGEGWYYRHQIAICSAVFWLVFALFTGYLFHAFRRWRSQPRDHAPSQSTVA